MSQKIFITVLLTICLNVSFVIHSMKPNYPGLLCTIEGIDGAGKSTLIKNLNQLFATKNIKIFFTKEPGATNLGKKIRRMILEKEVSTCTLSEFLLFAADRAQHFQEFILPQLQQGALIVSDRMADSSLAYQGYLKGLDINMINIVNAWCMQEIKADITFYLKISAADAKKRINTTRDTSDKFEQDLLDHLDKLIHAFDTIFKDRDNVVTIDAMQDSQAIAQTAFEEILKLYQEKQHANR